MSQAHTESMNRLMEEFGRLPGIGPRTAERLAYYILKQPAEKALALATAIKEVKVQIKNYLMLCLLFHGQRIVLPHNRFS